MRNEHVIGVDFGTESARAVLVRVRDGAEIASAVHPYEHGVMDEVLHYSDRALPPEYALQDPDDYLAALTAAVRSVVTRAGVDVESIVGVGVDTTACTLVHVDGDLAPLSRRADLRAEPLAYARLWKHHAAQPEAEEIIAAAVARGGMFLPEYGGRISSEWLLPKSLQTLREAPEVYAASARILEQQDWIVSTLVGREVRGASVAGFKGNYRAEDPAHGGYPSAEFLDAIEEGFSSVLEKTGGELLEPAAPAGTLSPKWARRLGLSERTVVAIGVIDAHAAVLGCGATVPGTMVAVMGTSVCNLLVSPEHARPIGIQGVVRDGIVPGMWAYEAGQAGFGDTFGWFARTMASADVADVAALSGRSVFEVLESQAAPLRPAESGVLVLDWFNGNRSVLIDSRLAGAILGMTLGTRPHHVYRALLEAAAFGQRIIVEAFESAGVAVDRYLACGGIPRKSPLLMQIMADVLGRPVEVASSAHTSAVGAAMHAAIATGALDWDSAAAAAPPIARVYEPDPRASAAYEPLFALYRRAHDALGVADADLMHALRDLQAAALTDH